MLVVRAPADQGFLVRPHWGATGDVRPILTLDSCFDAFFFTRTGIHSLETPGVAINEDNRRASFQFPRPQRGREFEVADAWPSAGSTSKNVQSSAFPSTRCPVGRRDVIRPTRLGLASSRRLLSTGSGSTLLPRCRPLVQCDGSSDESPRFRRLRTAAIRVRVPMIFVQILSRDPRCSIRNLTPRSIGAGPSGNSRLVGR